MSEITYSCSVGEGVWQVPLWGSPNDRFWYIHNIKTGAFKRIGKVGAKRTNYYLKAISEAQYRNAEIVKKQQAALEELSKMEW
jgi:hypothetical protein